MIDGIKYVGDSQFIITNSKLMELLETEVEFRVRDHLFALGYPDSRDTRSALNDLYPGLGMTAYAVADTIVDRLINQ